MECLAFKPYCNLRLAVHVFCKLLYGAHCICVLRAFILKEFGKLNGYEIFGPSRSSSLARWCYRGCGRVARVCRSPAWLIAALYAAVFSGILCEQRIARRFLKINRIPSCCPSASQPLGTYPIVGVPWEWNVVVRALEGSCIRGKFMPSTPVCILA